MSTLDSDSFFVRLASWHGTRYGKLLLYEHCDNDLRGGTGLHLLYQLHAMYVIKFCSLYWQGTYLINLHAIHLTTILLHFIFFLWARWILVVCCLSA